MARLTSLIDKQDNNEKVRDQIAAILALEIANQKALAIAAGETSRDFNFKVFVERSKPFSALTYSTTGEPDGNLAEGVINVLFDNDVFDNKNSDQTYRQRVKGTFYIDCYAHKNRVEGDYEDLNVAGDELTSKESDRIARLARNIIMSATYYQLGLGWKELGKGNNIVFRRNIIKREKFLPQDREGKIFENIIATRLTLEVEYDEFSPQVDTRDFELIHTDVVRDEIGGMVYVEIENDFT